MRIEWSPLALERARTQAEYIAEDDPSAARKWLESLFSVTEQVRDFPDSGRVVPEMSRDDLRELLWNDYRIIYRIESERISILTVRHARQKLRSDELDTG